MDDFPDEHDITQLKLLWCGGSAQRGGGQRARVVGAGAGDDTFSLRVYYIHTTHQEEADLGRDAGNERCGSGEYCRPQARRMQWLDCADL